MIVLARYKFGGRHRGGEDRAGSGEGKEHDREKHGRWIGEKMKGRDLEKGRKDWEDD